MGPADRRSCPYYSKFRLRKKAVFHSGRGFDLWLNQHTRRYQLLIAGHSGAGEPKLSLWRAEDMGNLTLSQQFSTFQPNFLRLSSFVESLALCYAPCVGCESCGKQEEIQEKYHFWRKKVKLVDIW